jgi:hypothetical protein
LHSSSQQQSWYRNRDFWFRAIDCATGIAWRALERNTEGILTCSTQLFDADTQVEREELDGADKSIWSIYGRPNTTEPTAYVFGDVGVEFLQEFEPLVVPMALCHLANNFATEVIQCRKKVTVSCQ